MEYLIYFDYKTVYLYKINHKNMTMQKYKFSYLMDLLNYILDNEIKSVIFYSIGDLRLLYDNLMLNHVDCSVDNTIYKWRMELPHSIRVCTTPLYYYELQGYKYAKHSK